MTRENEHRPDMAEQNMGQQSPEDPKAKFRSMVEDAKKSAKYVGEQNPGTPATARELQKQAKMWGEMSQEDNRSAEQKAQFSQASEHYQKAAGKNQEMVNLRLNHLNPEQQQAWTEKHDMLERIIDNYTKDLSKFQGTTQERIRITDELVSYEKQRDELEASLPKL